MAVMFPPWKDVIVVFCKADRYIVLEQEGLGSRGRRVDLVSLPLCTR